MMEKIKNIMDNLSIEALKEVVSGLILRNDAPDFLVEYGLSKLENLLSEEEFIAFADAS